MPRWEYVLVRADNTGGTMGDVGPDPTYSDVGTYWATVTLLSAEIKEANKVDLSTRAYRVRFRDTPTVEVRNTQIVLVDRNREILTPADPSANPDGYGRDTTIIAIDSRKVLPE